MTTTARSLRTLSLAAALVLPCVAACDAESNPLAAVCCTEFKVGADLSSVDFGLEGEVRGRFLVLAQASSDLAATATGALLDVQAACRNIAVELDAPQTGVARRSRRP
ncbi:MAG TPA: hypothetical protein VM204_09420, partial [Gaiellaceae bacterium]|nr:hypothetical protein [Gaiellaceae bacterium]